MIKEGISKTEFIKEYVDAHYGGCGTVCTILVAIFFFAGFWTYTLTWWFLAIPTYCIGSSIKKNMWITEHQEEINQAFEVYYANIQKRNNYRMEQKEQGIITCPHCLSTNVQLYTDIHNSFSGRYEYSKPKMVCLMCGKTFNIGE